MQYKLWFRHLVALVALLPLSPAQASPNEISKDKLSLYQEFNQIIQAEPSPAMVNLAQNMLTELQPYPLYPYAHFQWLKIKAEQNQLAPKDILAFRQQYPDLPSYFSTALTNSWLNTQVQQQNWQIILDNATLFDASLTNRCILLQAEQAKTQSPLTTEQQQTLQQIWLTGQNLPKSCDPLMALWQSQSPPSLALIKQRAILAFEAQNSRLLTALAALGSDTWLDQIKNLLQRPQDLPAFVAQAENNELNKAIVLAAFPAFIKTQGVGQLDSADPFALFQTWAEKYQLNTSQTAQWQSQLLWQIFDSDIASLQRWRDQQITQLKEDRQTERRLRLAIAQRQDLSPWLALLSPEGKNKQEWQYWQAKNLHKQGKIQKSKQILQHLSRQHGFYPLLASADLGRAYQPTIEQLTPHKTTKQQTSPLASFATTLQRIQALYQLGVEKNQPAINREWWALLARADFAQKLWLSDYAKQQQWYDLAVEATIQAKAWGYLALRLPNAYLDWFELQLKNAPQIDRTFAMAIARQESAWKPYARSSADARGLMQLLPSTAQATAQKYQLPYTQQAQLFDPFYNIMLGTAHLQELAERFGDNRILIAAAYNAGSSRVDNWLKRSDGKLTMAEFIATIPFYETRNYVQNVLTYDYYYQILQQRPLIKFSKSEYDRLY